MHILSLLYEMLNNLAPTYLTSLSPQSVGSTSSYSLRNSPDLRPPMSRTTLYSESFLPSTIREWNTLQPVQRNSSTLESFKASISEPLNKPPAYFYHGSRRLQVLHARLRNNCSSLNSDLFNRNIINTPLCPACGEDENTFHYFFLSSRYVIQRRS